MIYREINLKNEFSALENDAILNCYCLSNFKEFSIGRKRKAILILPGGGYGFVSEREGEPIAVQFLAEDISTFVLTYTIGEKIKHPYPIIEAFAAIAYIRKHADELNVDPNKISVMGFSAGGHLAATVSCYYNDPFFAKYLGLTNDDIKVNGTILCYPVISSDLTISHSGSFVNLTKGDKELMEKYSIEKHITKDFPPTFIWTTGQDTLVHPFNSLNLAKELLNKGITCELHMYPLGWHGLALASKITDRAEDTVQSFYPIVHTWVKTCINFVNEIL